MEATATFDGTTRTFQKFKLDTPWVGSVYIPKAMMKDPPVSGKIKVVVTLEPAV